MVISCFSVLQAVSSEVEYAYYVTVTVRVSGKLMEEVDLLVRYGVFESRSAFLREAIREYLRTYSGVIRQMQEMRKVMSQS